MPITPARIFRENLNADSHLRAAIERYGESKQYGILNNYVAAAVSTPTLNFDAISVPGMLHELEINLKDLQLKVIPELSEFFEQTTLNIGAINKDPKAAINKNHKFVDKGLEDTVVQRIQVSAQMLSLFKELVAAHGNGLEFGILERQQFTGGAPQYKIKILARDEEVLARAIAQDLGMELPAKIEERGNAGR